MNASESCLAQFLLRNAPTLSWLRRVPWLGRLASGAGAKLVPRDSFAWVRIQGGPAQGLWLHLNPRTGSTYFAGGVEPEVQEALQQHLRPGMTFYDVGANIGFFFLLAARLVGDAGRVVAFEPDPEIAGRLREHVARNAFDWITVEERAVLSETRPVFFARTDSAASPDRGLGHVVAEGTKDTIQVAGVSLDGYAGTQLSRDFLKCDVEGAEAEVFKGAERLLKEKRPGIICEMHSEENERILVEKFSRLGYICRPCGTNHVLAIPQ